MIHPYNLIWFSFMRSSISLYVWDIYVSFPMNCSYSLPISHWLNHLPHPQLCWGSLYVRDRDLQSVVTSPVSSPHPCGSLDYWWWHHQGASPRWWHHQGASAFSPELLTPSCLVYVGDAVGKSPNQAKVGEPPASARCQGRPRQLCHPSCIQHACFINQICTWQRGSII